MSDLEKLKEVLDNQAERGIRDGYWVALDYTEKKQDGTVTLQLERLGVDFVFSTKGRLLGMSNRGGKESL
jgi:hypothetical protein